MSVVVEGTGVARMKVQGFWRVATAVPMLRGSDMYYPPHFLSWSLVITCGTHDMYVHGFILYKKIII